MISFPSSASSFVGSYGSLFLPIAADFVTTSVFKHATGFGKAQFAGSIVGAGVFCYSASRTNWTIGLAGAALYTLYKAVSVFRSHHTHPTNPTHHSSHDNPIIAPMEKSFKVLLKKMSYISDRALDYSHPQFTDHVKALKMELEPQITHHSKQWENPDVIEQTRSLMIQCQGLLYKIDGILDDQTQDLQANPQARLQKKAELLKSESFIYHCAFHRAFHFLTHSYRMIRCKAYTISLPNVQNFPGKNYASSPWGTELTVEYFNRFIQGDSPQREMNRIFNDTQDKLADLVKAVRPNFPYLVKDEQPFPGDYNNPTNPFRIFARETKTE